MKEKSSTALTPGSAENDNNFRSLGIVFEKLPTFAPK